MASCLKPGELESEYVFFVSLSNPYVSLGKLIFSLIVLATHGDSHRTTSLLGPQIHELFVNSCLVIGKQMRLYSGMSCL